MARRNWEELRREFILGNYKNLRVFAEEKGIPYNSDLRTHASTWRTDRQQTDRQTTDRIVSQVISKTAQKVSNQISITKARQYQIATKLLESAMKILEDDDQFFKHLVKLRTGYGPGDFKDEIITEKAEAANTKALANVAQAVKIAIDTQDSAMEYIDAAVQEKLQIERERLALEKQKAEKDNAGSDEEYAIIDPFAEGHND